MLASPSAEQSAIAAELAADLFSYRQGLRQLLQGHWDPESYRRLCEQFDQIQMRAPGLPGLSVTWTEVLISRAELMHALWSPQAPGRISGRVEALHARHERRLEELLAKCARYTCRPQALAPARAPAEPKD